MTQPHDAQKRYVEIATRRFAQAGFHGVSLAALARDAGVTKQALLHFFGSKERLYAAVLAQLSDRLLAEVEAVACPDPEATLTAYFEGWLSNMSARDEDARLVVRALLESEASARVWPLKPYLDRLVALAQDTPKWQVASTACVLAGVYQLIASLQYLTISRPTLRGMYGDDAQRDMEEAYESALRAAIDAFLR